MKKIQDWQIVVIAYTFYDEVDCNSGKHRRTYRETGKVVNLD